MLLALLAAIPALVQAVESLFGAFPGSGAIKKQTVIGALTNAAQAANTLPGVSVDVAQVQALASLSIDAYVAVENATNPAFGQMQSTAQNQ